MKQLFNLTSVFAWSSHWPVVHQLMQTCICFIFVKSQKLVHITSIIIKTSMGTLTLTLISGRHNNSKLWCAVCSDTDQNRLPDYPSLPRWLNEPWATMTLSLVGQLSVLGPLLVSIDPCIPGTSHKTRGFEDPLTQSSGHHTLVLVKVAQILMVAHFSYFQHIVNNWLLTLVA